MGKIALVEIFKSVQGEGYHAGRPAIFVRTSGCNLSCVFAEGSVCDTPYQQPNMKLTVLEIMAQVQELSGGISARVRWSNYREQRPMLIITGGEPTMTPLFDELVNAAIADGFYTAVETNGTKWRDGLARIDWICISPKESVIQGSPAQYHNHNPQDPRLDEEVTRCLDAYSDQPSGEYRYVISGDSEAPPYLEAFRHYVSPAVLSDGMGKEWQTGFPGFVPGALQRCQEIVWRDPRWRISLQTHKLMGVR